MAERNLAIFVWRVTTGPLGTPPSARLMEAFARQGFANRDLVRVLAQNGQRYTFIGPKARITRDRPRPFYQRTSGAWLVERIGPDITSTVRQTIQVVIGRSVERQAARSGYPADDVAGGFVSYNPAVNGTIRNWETGTIAVTPTRDRDPGLFGSGDALTGPTPETALQRTVRLSAIWGAVGLGAWLLWTQYAKKGGRRGLSR